MKSKKLFLVLMVTWILLSDMIFSQGLDNQIDALVETEWLAKNISDAHLIVLHYGSQADFNKEHIPGSRLVSLKEIIIDSENSLRHELPEKDKLERIMKSWGINTDSKIIISYDNENSLPAVARLFFTLDYIGLGGHIAILNGGLPKWKNENRPLSGSTTIFKDGNFIARINGEILADKNRIYSSLKNQKVVIIDARPPEQYSGKVPDNNSRRKGHIQGAVNIPFYNLMESDAPYVFKTREDLRRLFERNYVSSGSEVITYCGSGMWAAPVYFISKFLGYKTQLYDGSFQEWGNDSSLPIIEPVNIK